MGKVIWGNTNLKRGISTLFGALAGLWPVGSYAGFVDLELRPAAQVVSVGDTVALDVYAVSADGSDQSVGFVGVVFVWDATALSLVGHNDTGPFVWDSSGFPSDGGGVNGTFTDGDGYYQAIVSWGGATATATGAGLLVTTLEFSALPSAGGSTSVTIVSCIGSTCTRVLDKHPFDGNVMNVTGALGAPAEVTVQCQTNEQCDDGNPCTDDACGSDSLCHFTTNDANDPDDGLFCNGAEICVDGKIAVKEGSVPDCDDGLQCTHDTCNEDTDQCDHSMQTGYCLIGGQCIADGSVNPKNECEWCAAAADSSGWSPRPSGTSCGDASEAACDHADTCDGSGVCQENLEPAGRPCGDGSATPCTAPDTCDGSGGCTPNNAVDGTSCDDAKFCTVVDECVGGVCTGSGSPCGSQTCDEATDQCKAVGLALQAVGPGPFRIDDVIRIELYATSETDVDQPISALSAILQWDAAALEFVDNVDDGPYDWFLSGFPDDSQLDGLNNTFSDGNGLYQASSRPAPDPPALATLDGLLVTTFEFRAASAGTAEVRLIAQFGDFSETEVLDGETDGLDITAALGTPASVSIVDCFDDVDCDDGEFCTGIETCVDMVCTAGTPPNCDDGVFCNGIEQCEPAAGCVSLGNPCPDPGSCDEATGTCGGCESATTTAEGSRYLSVTPGSGDGSAVALLVTGDPNDEAVSCISLYVQPDGTLGPEAVYQPPAMWSTVHVTGPWVLPSTTYSVYTDCRVDGSGYLSAPQHATTWRWGDVNDDRAVQIDDVYLVVNGSRGEFLNGATVENLDLSPCWPDRQVDDEDVDSVQDAFAGGLFPCLGPCDACLPVAGPQNESPAMAKNRFLSINPGNAERATAIRVTFDSLPEPFDVWNGSELFVGQPRQVCENAGQGLDVSPPDCTAAPGLAQNWFWAAPLVCDSGSAHVMDWSTLSQHCVGGNNSGGSCGVDDDCPGGTCGSSAIVHLHHEGIIASDLAAGGGTIEFPAQYHVDSIDGGCLAGGGSGYSSPLYITQSGWGDLLLDNTQCPPGAPQGTVNLSDLLGLLRKFSNLPCAVSKPRGDLAGLGTGLVDFKISLPDLLASLSGFSNVSYPYAPTNPNNPCATGF